MSRKRKLKIGAALFFCLVGLINTSHAALNDLGNGLINDDTLDITWMKDANLVKTSCDANDVLWQAFEPSALPAVEQSGRTKTQICTENGTLNWFEAEVWMTILNAQNYFGHNDWRQPATNQPDASCETLVTPGPPAQHGGYNCRGSELGHLFNLSLGNPNHAGTGATGGTIGTACVGTVPHCFQNTAPFNNAQPFAYWSGNEFEIGTTNAWFFNIIFGTQVFNNKQQNNLFVWPVRSGQSTVVQPVPSLSIWGLGFMSVLLAFVARRRRDVHK